MSHLINQIGLDYFRRRFSSAFFIGPDGLPSFVNDVGDGYTVHCTKVTGSVDKISTENIRVPWAFFDSLERFRVPALGWRCGYKGKLLVHLQRDNGSYSMRGTGSGNMRPHFSPLTSVLADDGQVNTRLSPAQLCALTFDNSFIPLQQGVQEIRNGQRLSFAVSPTIAVSVKNDTVLEVYFRQFAVGTIDGNNNMKITVPHLRQQLGELR